MATIIEVQDTKLDNLSEYVETNDAEYCIKITKTCKNNAEEVEVVRSKAKFVKK